MQLHELKPIHKKKRRKRIGRGGKKGSYSGRGIKGQKARAGRKLQPLIRQWIKRYPKLRGYRRRSTPTPKFGLGVNLDILERKFASGEKITPKVLIEKEVIPRIKGRLPEVKILGRGELKKPLVIEGCLVSKKAKEKIEKAGGQIKSKIKTQNDKEKFKKILFRF